MCITSPEGCRRKREQRPPLGTRGGRLPSLSAPGLHACVRALTSRLCRTPGSRDWLRVTVRAPQRLTTCLVGPAHESTESSLAGAGPRHPGVRGGCGRDPARPTPPAACPKSSPASGRLLDFLRGRARARGRQAAPRAPRTLGAARKERRCLRVHTQTQRQRQNYSRAPAKPLRRDALR